jgi:hypothetical protein
MNCSLRRKRCNIFYIIPFILLLSLFGEHMYASPGGHVHTPPVNIGNRLYFTPACPIVAQNFNNAADVNGATSDPSATGWYLDASKVPNAAYFSIKSHRLKAQTLGGEGVWYSQVFSIAGYTGVQIDAKVSTEGSKTSAEYVKVFHKINGGPEILDTALYGNFGTPMITSPQMTGNTVQIVIRIYDTTSGNSEYYIEQYDVFKEVGPCSVSGITVTASANPGVLTCTSPSTTLTAGTTATGTTTYSWTGPNSFTSTSANPVVSTAGTYTVTGTNSAGTGTASVTVTANTTAPAGLTISSSSGNPGNPVLTCATTSITLTASSTTTGVSFNWSGPNSATSSSATITVSSPGTYIVTATNPTTGCTSTASTIVTQDTARPVALTTTAVPVSAQLTCTNSSVTFTAGSSTPGLSYTWSGPGGALPSSSVATVSAAGTYTLTATNPVNGCTASASSTVTQNIAAPGGVTTTATPTTAQITCVYPSVLLTSGSTTPGVTYAWSGPGGFTASGASATATAPGVYTVSVTDPTNGCVTTLPGTVTKNVSVPVGLSASPSDVISCFSPTIDLQGSSTTAGATFSWAGPGGYTASTAIAETSLPGNYTLTVTNPLNGCTASTGTTVTADTVSPANVTASNNGPLNCITTSVTLTSSTSTATNDFLWVTPDNNFISGATTVVTTPGIYTIVVTNDNNGCSSQATTTVLQNTTGCTGSSALTTTSTANAGRRSLQDATVDAVTGFQYKAYPNPFSSSAFVEFAAPTSSLVTVEIYSSYGYREKLLFNSVVNSNQAYKLELSATGISSGAHFCIIRNGAKVYSAKLILIK